MTDDFIPLARPDITQEEIDEVVDTLRSGWLAFGPKTQRFEQEFARYIGARHAVAVSSCTAGMHLALLACGIGEGDEVITSALTFPSTASVIVHTGARVVLADICYDDLNIDPADIERKLTPRTKAIMPVVYAGQPCRMDEIMDLARRHGLRVIEDAATAAGAKYKGRFDGTIAHASIFSFYAIKNMTTGEGGMVTTDDSELAARVAVLRNQGQDTDAWKRYAATGAPYYTVDAAGFNYRMTDLEASLGLVQLRKLEAMNRRRAELAALYTRLFAGCETVETPTVRPEVTSNWHLYVIRLRNTPVPRNEVVERLSAKGIRSSVHYYPVHYQPYYRERLGLRKGDLPVTEAEFERLISLPLYPGMRDADVERVVEAVRECTRPA
ncbi:MAG TPA: DegT/DnrJ/EryC1/StrS aminotransferase family protein [Dehalococcoidia bacterium]|nr:DegT/DnrJ/EryC1/StrS aminotransferase family protein [Dehalococcoidia bacterium]